MERLRDYAELQIAAALPKPFRVIELLNVVRHVFQASCGNTTANQRTSQRIHARPQAIPIGNKSNPVLCKP